MDLKFSPDCLIYLWLFQCKRNKKHNGRVHFYWPRIMKPQTPRACYRGTNKVSEARKENNGPVKKVCWRENAIMADSHLYSILNTFLQSQYNVRLSYKSMLGQKPINISLTSCLLLEPLSITNTISHSTLKSSWVHFFLRKNKWIKNKFCWTKQLKQCILYIK